MRFVRDDARKQKSASVGPSLDAFLLTRNVFLGEGDL